jgi:hypothetical protein
MNAKLMAFATTAIAVVAGIYVYNEFIAPAPAVTTEVDPNAFAGRRRAKRARR